MTVDADSLPAGHHVFTHVLPSGENIHIDVSGLRSAVVLNPNFDHQRKLIPIDPHLAHTFVRDNIVSPQRVVQLMGRHRHEADLLRMEPLVFCADGSFTDGAPDVFFVDGHHRYVMCAVFQLTSAPAYIVPPDFWARFRISGLPSISQQELLDLPIRPRNY